jgi:hypothetical protein
MHRLVEAVSEQDLFMDDDQAARRRIGGQIVAGYRRVPQTDDEVAAATEAARSSIEAEPWFEPQVGSERKPTDA